MISDLHSFTYPCVIIDVPADMWIEEVIKVVVSGIGVEVFTNVNAVLVAAVTSL